MNNRKITSTEFFADASGDAQHRMTEMAQGYAQMPIRDKASVLFACVAHGMVDAAGIPFRQSANLRYAWALVALTSLTLLVPPSCVAQPATRSPVRDPRRKIAKRIPSWLELKQRNIVMQQRDYSCGAAALATVVRYYWGDDVDEEFFLDALGELLTDEEARDRVENGLAMSDLRRVAVRTGYRAVVGRLTFEKLIEAKVPLVVGVTVDDFDHFVVYRGTDGWWVYLADPIRGNIRVTVPTFLKQWQENAVLVVHKPGAKVRDISPLTVRESEICLGTVNDQLLRTVPSRQAPTLARPTAR